VQHPELLLLDNAVSRLAERYITTRRLTVSQRDSLEEYQADLQVLIGTLAGPAREYADQVAALARTLLEAKGGRQAGAGHHAGSDAHRAA